MYFKITSFIIALSIGVFACSSSKNISVKANSATIKDACKTEALKRYGVDTVFQYSPDSAYILCSKKLPENNLNPNVLIEFFVVESATCNIVYDDKISGAVISWHNNEDLLIVKQKGFIENDVDNGKYSYTINVKTHIRKEIHEDKSNQNIK